MAQIQVTDLTFCYVGSFDNIFENVTFGIDTDWKLGFIGRNGKGKTTFAKLLSGKYEYRGVITAPNLHFDYFPYQVEEADFETRNEIESLIVGDTIEKPVHEDITYGDIHESRDNLWNFLYFTGYLKKTGERPQEESIYLELAIPNAEIRSIYRNTILTWFDKKIQKADLSPWFTAIEMDDCEAFGNFVSDQLLNTISFFRLCRVLLPRFSHRSSKDFTEIQGPF